MAGRVLILFASMSAFKIDAMLVPNTQHSDVRENFPTITSQRHTIGDLPSKANEGEIMELQMYSRKLEAGSTHGLAGIPTILIPTLMQLMGRKYTFILSCLFGVIGWIIVNFAQSVIAIIISEVFHGLCTNSLITVSLLTISEMLDPKFRIISMTIYGVNQTIGMALVVIIGQYLHWKTVAVILCVPIIIALLISLVWPESPAWLAYRGEFDKCEKAFIWLRGNDEISRKELEQLIAAQKEILKQDQLKGKRRINKRLFTNLLRQVTRRDFYLPCFHIFVLLFLVYWSGMVVLFIYTVEMIQKVTSSNSAPTIGVITIYVILVVGNIITTFLYKRFNNKTIVTVSGVGVSIFWFLTSVVTYLQSVGVIAPDSYLSLYCLIALTAAYSFGVSMCGFSISAELMPVKHRGLGGAVYVILICLLHTSSLKLSPYLFVYINFWGTFLLFAVNAAMATLFIWRYVPETKNRTLQEIEDIYNHGRVIRRDVEVIENVNV